jgi:glucose/mannose transport system substrate-binding protein
MRLRTLLGSTLLLGLLGCSSSSKDPATNDGSTTGKDQQVLEVFSWWVAPGEAEALQGLVDVYKKENVGARVAQTPNVTGGNWQALMGAQIDQSPWDIVQLSASDLTGFQADHPGAFMELDELYARDNLPDVMIPEILDAVTRDGHQYGVVTGIHRNNSFIYNKQIFDEQKLEPPATIPEFLAVAKKLKKAGITPVATAFQTWVLRILFDEMMAGTMGAQGFDDFIKGKASPTDPDVQANISSAIDTFDTIITDYVDVDASTPETYEWSNAAEDMHKNKAAMMFHGDWAKGYLVHLGWTPGVDFGVLGPPGASDLFVYGADMFCQPTTAPNPDLSQSFLEVVASPEGQVKFNSYKGATPMRSDVRAQLDEPGQLSLDGLRDAKVRMPGHANDGWDAGIAAFVKDHDKDALLQVYIDTPP